MSRQDTQGKMPQGWRNSSRSYFYDKLRAERGAEIKGKVRKLASTRDSDAVASAKAGNKSQALGLAVRESKNKFHDQLITKLRGESLTAEGYNRNELRKPAPGGNRAAQG